MLYVFSMASVSENMRVAMILFFSGVLLIVFGRYVWKSKRPDKVPGYRKMPGEDTATYSKYLGQTHMYAGVALVLLSFPLNEETPNGYFAIVMLGLCVIFIVIAVLTFIKAVKTRRK